MQQADTVTVEQALPRATLRRAATRTKVYLFLLLVAIPSDAFVPTARLLREAGKPATPIMIVGMVWIFWQHWPELFFAAPKLWRRLLLICLGIAFLSSVAFAVNVLLDISYWDGLRTPPTQFVSQAMMFALVPPALIAHAWLFSKEEVRACVVRYVPAATLIHVLTILAQWAGLLRETALPLSWFRGMYLKGGAKPTGMMTEPSYVGAFAATYGLALLLGMPTKRTYDRVLAVAAMVLAMVLGGKTLVPVLVGGLIAYGYQVRAKLFNWRVFAAAALVLLITAYLAATYAVLDVRTNLSSGMRIGSTILALNAAAAGYGLLGIGFGQFHFVYSPRFAPAFLAYVPEAQWYYSHVVDARASTYNLPARILVEAGIAGFLLFCYLVRLLFRNGRLYDDSWHRMGAVIAGASLGFLMTQDTYYYAAFVCGAAMLASTSLRAARA